MWPFKKSQGDELEHWIASADNFNYPPRTFYDELEKALSERKVPDMTIEKVEFGEGGLLSDQRTYLRLQRERLLFDICAAAFGTGYFFSCRVVKLPVLVKFWHVAVLCLLFLGMQYEFSRLIGFVPGCIALGTFILALGLTLHNASTVSNLSVDGMLCRAPVLGVIYEAWFRRETYFRYDTRLMYLDLIPRVCRELCDAITAAKGILLVSEYRTAPILGELYKRITREKPGK